MKVYIAGPYSNDPELNTYKAMEMANRVLEAGHSPFLPHLYHFWNSQFPHDCEVWTRIGLEWLTVCKALIRIPGESLGADVEVVAAIELYIPVFSSLEAFLVIAPKLEEVLRSGHKFELKITGSPSVKCEMEKLK